MFFQHFVATVPAGYWPCNQNHRAPSLAWPGLARSSATWPGLAKGFFGVALGQLLVANGRNNHAKHSTKSSIGSIVTLHFESAIKVVYLVRCKASVYSFIYNHSFHSKWLKITKNKSPRTPRACVQQSGPKSGFWPSFKSRAINEILVDFDNLVCWVTAVPGPKKQQRFRQIPQLCLREMEKMQAHSAP